MNWTGALLVFVIALNVVACDGTSGSPTPSGSGIQGVVTAGPVCPVERPNDPGCAPRPVPDALVIVRGPDGAEVAQARTNADGRYRVEVPPGRYTVEGAPVEGLMGNPAPIEVEVTDGIAAVDLEYDTGIR